MVAAVLDKGVIAQHPEPAARANERPDPVKFLLAQWFVRIRDHQDLIGVQRVGYLGDDLPGAAEQSCVLWYKAEHPAGRPGKAGVIRLGETDNAAVKEGNLPGPGRA